MGMNSLPQLSNLYPELFSKGCELDIKPDPPGCHECEQTIDGGASGLTIAGTTTEVSRVLLELYRDLRDAKAQILRAQDWRQQLRLNLEQIEQLAPSQKQCLRPAQTSRQDLEATLPEIPAYMKRDRWKWALGRKTEFEKITAQNDRVSRSYLI